MEQLAWILPLVAAVSISVLNAVLKNHKSMKPGVSRVLRVIVDVLSLLTNSDSPGTLKAPLKTSAKPEQKLKDFVRELRGNIK
jgi:hypothetical protein